MTLVYVMFGMLLGDALHVFIVRHIPHKWRWTVWIALFVIIGICAIIYWWNGRD